MIEHDYTETAQFATVGARKGLLLAGSGPATQ